jgi:hypothetical protein
LKSTNPDNRRAAQENYQPRAGNTGNLQKPSARHRLFGLLPTLRKAHLVFLE